MSRERTGCWMSDKRAACFPSHLGAIPLLAASRRALWCPAFIAVESSCTMSSPSLSLSSIKVQVRCSVHGGIICGRRSRTGVVQSWQPSIFKLRLVSPDSSFSLSSHKSLSSATLMAFCPIASRSFIHVARGIIAVFFR